jgi:uncharacterized membrane protein
MMQLFTQYVSVTGYALEAVGVLIIVLGVIRASARTLVRIGGKSKDELYIRFRQDFARAMMLGLEFLIAGDIIRTVIVVHSVLDVLSLGLLVLIRTVLVFTIHLEVEGRWPWQRSGAAGAQRAAAPRDR